MLEKSDQTRFLVRTREGATMGPFDKDMLDKLLLAGAVGMQDELSLEGDDHWATIERVLHEASISPAGKSEAPDDQNVTMPLRGGRDGDRTSERPEGLCAFCGSDFTQRLAAIYESGTSVTTTSESSLDIAFLGTSVAPITGSSDSVTTTQTALASRLAPPEEMRLGNEWYVALWVLPLAVGGLAGAIAWGVTGTKTLSGQVKDAAIIAGGITMFLALFAAYGKQLMINQYNRQELPNLLKRWQNSWYCHRCGRITDR